MYIQHPGLYDSECWLVNKWFSSFHMNEPVCCVVRLNEVTDAVWQTPTLYQVNLILPSAHDDAGHLMV